ncbi:MAG: hypothetical protein ABSF88_02960 [Candidatus Aminicenantales bacterium]
MSKLPISDSGNLDLRFSPAAFLLGWLAVSYQIFLLREFSAHFYGNELVFGLVLAAWLLWGGLGSLWASRRGGARWPALFFAALLIAPFCFSALRFSRLALGLLPGELTGLLPIFIFAFILTFFINFPLGAAFASTVRREGPLPRIYLWESAGAATGSLVTYLGLIPRLSNWRAIAVTGAVAATAAFINFRKKIPAGLLIAALSISVAFFVLDIPTQRMIWKPFTLVESRDGRYGKLQVIKTSEQVTLYDNGLRVYSFPDPASAEESVHFALLQNPEARRVLLIGGGAGGALAEVLKYPKTEVDYVELDPDIIRISESFLPPSASGVLKDPRVHIILGDGRAFLEATTAFYDIVILNLPEPATAQINRFYTREFFSRVRTKLNTGGVFSFRVPSAENYISPELQKFLSTMSATLRQAFPEIKIIPGDSNIFLASASPLHADADDFIRTIKRFRIQNKFISPEQLPARLHPLRIRALAEKIASGPGLLNSDLHPVSYFFDSVLWSAQFKGAESKILTFFARIPVHWLLDIPLLLLAGILVFIRFGSSSSGNSIVPVALMGMTTMAGEIMLILIYQTLYGYVYGQIALLLTAFMSGLTLGAFVSSKRKKHRYSHLILLQSGLLILVAAVWFSLGSRLAGPLLYPFLLSLGYLGGDFFIVANTLFFKEKTQAGQAYGWDLLGSFLAAAGLSSVLIPLAGLPILFQYLLLVNSFGLLFIVTGRKKAR